MTEMQASQTTGEVAVGHDWKPRASSQTRSFLARLFQSEARSLRPDSYLLEELLSSLKRDQFVLQSLQEALRHCRLGEIPTELASRAIQRCVALTMECDVIGANAAMSCNAGEKATVILQTLVRQDASAAPEPVRPLLFKLLVSAAWIARDFGVAESFVEAARRMDTAARFSGYLDGLKRLLHARSELQAGRNDVAVRICQTLARETKVDDPLKALALELQSDAFRKLGDCEREQKVLEDWENLLRALPNGPCDLAVSAETDGTSPGIFGGSRSEEILQHYSRLAVLYELSPRTRGYAKGIYGRFLNTAHHNWVDPAASELGSIAQRGARLMPEQKPQELGKDAEHIHSGITIIEPDRAYGKMSDRALDGLLSELTAMPASTYCAVVVGQIDVKERQFRLREALGLPVDQLLREIHDTSQALSTFQPDKASVVWKGQPMEWIVLPHQERGADLRSLSFGVRVDQVRDQMDLSLYVLFTYRPPLNSDARNELANLLRKKPEQLGGYNALQGMAVELVKRAAKRVEQKAGADRQQKGPIRL
ncbi:MAG: hypothetical protein WCI73_08080 [Phycisphaerae bacterium]